MKALKASPLSETLPMMAFNPIFTALLSFLFQGQSITLLGWTGILFISIGIYCVHLSKVIFKSGALQPLIKAFSSRGSQYMLVVALTWSFGAYFSKMMVSGSSPMFSTFCGGVNGVITTAIVALIFGKKIRLKQYLQHGKSLIPIGLTYYIANITSSIALKEGVTAYVFSIKRGSIILSSIGGKYLFQEKLNVTKILGLIFIFTGIALIAI